MPSEEEQLRHAFTHAPYAAWCSSCIAHRARPDRHERSGEASDTGCPVISFDFAYAKASGQEPEGAQGANGNSNSALWLVMVGSHIGYFGVVPVKSKNQTNLLAHEILAFSQVLGHHEVGYFGDNEPTVRQILRTLLNARHALGLRIRVFTTKTKDPAGNGLAETAIGRIRSLAGTLTEDVYEQTGVGSGHPLWGWAARHAAWLINRFQPEKGRTNFEVIYGNTYSGTISKFAEPVYGYVKVGNKKGDPKWKLGLCTGKTEAQDAYIIAEGHQVMC